jgi:DNA-binding transcriptional MerR regulator
MTAAPVPTSAHFFSISEVAEMTGLKASTLRYWETVFPTLRPKKNRSGARAYTHADIRLVRRLDALLHEEKYTIEGANQVLSRESDAEQAGGWQAELVELRGLLQEVLHRL